MNVLSIHTARGLYVLAYRKLYLDVNARSLRPDDEITICTEFILGDTKESIRKCLDALVEYVKKNGESQVTGKRANSRALGVKPFSTATEDAFMENLNHALQNIWLSQNRFSVKKEVAISQAFQTIQTAATCSILTTLILLSMNAWGSPRSRCWRSNWTEKINYFSVMH